MYEQSLNITTGDTTIANTATETDLSSHTLLGGNLSIANKVKLEVSGKISFAGANSITLRLYYNNNLIATSVVTSTGALSDVGIVIIGELNGDGSVNAQFGTLQVHSQVPSTVGWGQLTEASGGDLNIKITGQWNAASSSNTITNHHAVLSVLGIGTIPEPLELEDATEIIYIDSKLNNLRYDLRKDVYFYAPLNHDLEFYGYGTAGFTRSSASTAVWRDGGSHSVGVDEPRFEYSGETGLGLALTSTETLSFSTDNALDDSNTICWLFNGAYKSTKRGDTNPFNSSGVWTGGNGHVKEIVKYNRQITTAEDSETETALT